MTKKETIIFIIVCAACFVAGLLCCSYKGLRCIS